MVSARISAVDYWLPEGTLSNADLSREFPEWSVEKIAAKTGINNRHIAREDQSSSDLAAAAVNKLLERTAFPREEVDFLLVCTQSPDFYMPSTAGIVQAKVGLRSGIGATDMNLGCSGYIYALGLAKGLIETGFVRNVLVVTVDTYSRYVNRGDKSVRTLFGDGAAATLVTDDAPSSQLEGFVYGTDGTGAGSLIVPAGGIRSGVELAPNADPAKRNLDTNGYDLYMDGPAIFNFTLEVVPGVVERVLLQSGRKMADIDLFVFHQANAFMLESIRRKLSIEPEKFYISMSEAGNTVSSTIPIALADAEREGRLRGGMTVMLVGFGVGLSWGATVVTW